MFKIFIALFLSLFALQADASFFAPKYDREYIPYNEAEASKTKSCNSVLASYDKLYDNLDAKMALQKQNNTRTDRSNFLVGWESRLFLGEATVRSFSELKTVTEEAIRDCLVANKETEALKKAEKEAKEKKEKAKERAEKRQLAIQKALSECDMDFLNRLNQAEKMQTFKQRQSCKNGVSNSTIKQPEVATSNNELIMLLMKQIELLSKQLAELKAKTQ